MTVGELKKQLSEWDDDDAIVLSRGNEHPSFKITHVEDSTNVGVIQIRYTDFETSNFWEE